MAKKTINIGQSANDRTGDVHRTAFAKCNDNFDELYASLVPIVANFTSDGEVRFYASEAMTLAQQATSGIGTVTYEKSTSGAPDDFASTTSPITLEEGAWLKISATSVSALFAVALKRTA